MSRLLELSAGARIADYRIEKLIGRGGMGAVYAAWQESVGRRVALKVLPAGVAPERGFWRLRREARLLGRLAHPGIVRVFAAGVDGATPYYAMELVEGTTLRALFAASATLDAGTPTSTPAPIAFAVDLIAQVADALACSHAAGIVHRDVKPGNILVRHDGRALLSDFGLAQDSSAADLTATGELAGTLHYMSPEQVRGERVDHRSDVYSLGVVLYEALTGARPFAGASAGAVLDAISVQAPRDPRALRPDLSPSLTAVVSKAIAKEVAERYQSAGALAADLRAGVRGEPVTARPPTRWQRWRRQARREPWRLAAVALAIVAALGGPIVWRQYTAALVARGERADAALKEMNRLALSVQVEAAERTSARFRVARPHLIPAMTTWLQNVGRPLVDQLPATADFVRALRERALPYGAADAAADRMSHPKAQRAADAERTIAWLATRLSSADLDPEQRQAFRVTVARLEQELGGLRNELSSRRTWRFAEAREQVLHDQAAALFQRLQEFAAAETGTFAHVETQLAAAITNRRRCGEEGAAAWKETAAAIAADPRYRGLVLPPQTDLLPLGRDARSGLYEFVHLRSGEPGREIPRRDDDDEIVPDADMGIVLVLLPMGTFAMGAQSADQALPNHDPQAKASEGPVHSVALAAFLVGKYEVTQSQWLRLAGDRPSKRHGKQSLIVQAWPVDNMSQARARTVVADHGLALPTEAQWEYACRAGGASPFSFGARLAAPRHANFADSTAAAVPDIPWRCETDLTDGHVRPAPVGSFAPNAYGLFDMHGNVAEWCDDVMLDYARPPTEDEGRRRLTSTDTDFVTARGGSFVQSLPDARCSARSRTTANAVDQSIGVRVARRIEEDTRDPR